MAVDQVRDLMQQQALEVDLAKTLLERPGKVGDDLDDLGDKGLVGGDLGVPVLDVLPQYDGDQGIQLEVHIVAARQRGQEALDGGGRAARGFPLVRVLRAEAAADQKGGGTVREGVRRGIAGGGATASSSKRRRCWCPHCWP